MFVWDGASWTEQAKLVASDADRGGWFGSSVAVDGDTVAIGAERGDDPSCACFLPGAVYVFERSGSSWTERAKLVGSSPNGDLNGFGHSVALDGETLAIGTYPDNLCECVEYGSVYVFVREGSGWVEQAKLWRPQSGGGEGFGQSVAVDGDTLLVGAAFTDVQAHDSGAAYVYRRDASDWTQAARLVATDRGTHHLFGVSVALGGDVALIGAMGVDESAGAAYVFGRDGSAWLQQAKLGASDGSAGQLFGGSVALDGDVALIGAVGDDAQGINSGGAYMFERNGGVWVEQARLWRSSPVQSDDYGGLLVVNGDVAVVGAQNADDRMGAAYVFRAREPAGSRFDYPFGSGECSSYALADYHVEEGRDFLDPAHAEPHSGEDWSRVIGDGDLGDEVCVVGGGVVIAAGNYFAPAHPWGNVVLVEHVLLDGSRRWTQYAHLDTIAPGVVPGAWVNRGEVIGTVGQGCNADRSECPYSAHLHFEIRADRVPPDHWPMAEETARAQYVDPTDRSWDWAGSGVGFIETHRFADILGSVFAADIGWLLAEQITVGCEPRGESFCPHAPVTRAQMASFLVRAFDFAPVAVNRFDDVSGTHMANINALAEAGITVGCNAKGSLYCPDDPVSRAQMASFLARALMLDPVHGDVFDDVSGVHEASINSIAQEGITLGCNEGGDLYCPHAPVTRGQMAAFLHRALG